MPVPDSAMLTSSIFDPSICAPNKPVRVTLVAAPSTTYHCLVLTYDASFLQLRYADGGTVKNLTLKLSDVLTGVYTIDPLYTVDEATAI